MLPGQGRSDARDVEAGFIGEQDNRFGSVAGQGVAQVVGLVDPDAMAGVSGLPKDGIDRRYVVVLATDYDDRNTHGFTQGQHP